MTKKLRLMFGIGLLLLILAGSFLVYQRLTIAGSANLYPGSCLGTWQNPDKAQGRPDTNDTALINKENSAIFSEGGIKEIYCGSFNGDFSEGDIKLIKAVTLKFSWLVSDRELQAATSSIIIIQSPATSSEAVSQNTNDVINQILNNIHVDEVQLIISTTTSEITITTDSTPSPPVGGSGQASETENAAAISNSAEIINEQPEITAPTLEVATSSPTSWWKKFNFFFAEDQVGNVQQTTDNIQQEITTATSSLDSPIAPTEDFLKVSYTLDGVNWQALGVVNKNNWQDTSFQIPVYQLEDVKKIQIKIESLPIINKTPYVYLDGMAFGVEYETSSDFQSKTASILSQSSNPRVSPNVSYNRNSPGSNTADSINFNISVNSFEDFGFDDGCGLGSRPCNFWGVGVESNENELTNSTCVSSETLSYTFNMVLPKANYIGVMVFAGDTQESCEAGGELSKFLEGDSNYIIFSP